MNIYTIRRHSRQIVISIIALVIISMTFVLVTKRQDFSQPCRIVKLNSQSITAEEWNDHYWEGTLVTVEIPATNCEAEVGDFVNLKAELVDNDGNVLTTVPEQTGNVYVVTSIDKAEGLWWLVQGPMTYQVGQGATSMPITDKSIKVGDLVNDEGQKVDMFGRLA